MEEQSLKSKTVKGFGWSAIDTGARLGISFVVSLVLARLLGPDEYGLIGILAIFISIFNAIVDSGFTNALIRKAHTTDIDYSTVFFVNLIVSVFMAATLFCCADPIASFFGREELVSLTRTMSCIVVINALCIVQKARTTKAIDFKTQTKITLISAFVSGVLGISMAYFGYGVWSLVGQQISCQVITTALFWLYNRWIPRFVFSWESFWEMWSFGWKLLVSKLIETIWQEVYQVVIGKCYSPTNLGYYTRAQQFSSMCSSTLTTVVQRVSFPVLSTIQDEQIRLKNAYRKVIKMTMYVAFILMFGMMASAKSMICCLIGEQWLPCVPMLQLVSLTMVLFPLHALNLNMLQVKGRSDIYLKLEIIKKVIAIVPIVLGVFVGIYSMLVSSILVGVLSYFLNAFYSGPMVNYSISEQLRDLIPSFMIAIIMAFVVYLIGCIRLNYYCLFSLQIITGAFVIIVLSKLFKLNEYEELKNIILRIKK